MSLDDSFSLADRLAAYVPAALRRASARDASAGSTSAASFPTALMCCSGARRRGEDGSSGEEELGLDVDGVEGGGAASERRRPRGDRGGAHEVEALLARRSRRGRSSNEGDDSEESDERTDDDDDDDGADAISLLSNIADLDAQGAERERTQRRARKGAKKNKSRNGTRSCALFGFDPTALGFGLWGKPKSRQRTRSRRGVYEDGSDDENGFARRARGSARRSGVATTTRTTDGQTSALFSVDDDADDNDDDDDDRRSRPRTESSGSVVLESGDEDAGLLPDAAIARLSQSGTSGPLSSDPAPGATGADSHPPASRGGRGTMADPQADEQATKDAATDAALAAEEAALAEAEEAEAKARRKAARRVVREARGRAKFGTEAEAEAAAGGFDLGAVDADQAAEEEGQDGAVVDDDFDGFQGGPPGELQAYDRPAERKQARPYEVHHHHYHFAPPPQQPVGDYDRRQHPLGHLGAEGPLGTSNESPAPYGFRSPLSGMQEFEPSHSSSPNVSSSTGGFDGNGVLASSSNLASPDQLASDSRERGGENASARQEEEEPDMGDFGLGLGPPRRVRRNAGGGGASGGSASRSGGGSSQSGSRGGYRERASHRRKESMSSRGTDPSTFAGAYGLGVHQQLAGEGRIPLPTSPTVSNTSAPLEHHYQNRYQHQSPHPYPYQAEGHADAHVPSTQGSSSAGRRGSSSKPSYRERRGRQAVNLETSSAATGSSSLSAGSGSGSGMGSARPETPREGGGGWTSPAVGGAPSWSDGGASSAAAHQGQHGQGAQSPVKVGLFSRPRNPTAVFGGGGAGAAAGGVLNMFGGGRRMDEDDMAEADGL